MSGILEQNYDWKPKYIEKMETKEAILEDCLKDLGESIFYELAKDDTKRILNKDMSYKFIIEYDLFDKIYSLIIETTQKHIKNSIERGSGLINYQMNCHEVIAKIISRIVNNFKNRFDKRYKDHISINRDNFSEELLNYDDALSILIAEEEAKLETKKDDFLTAVHLRLKAKAIQTASKKLCKELINRANELQFGGVENKQYVKYIIWA